MEYTHTHTHTHMHACVVVVCDEKFLKGKLFTTTHKRFVHVARIHPSLCEQRQADEIIVLCGWNKQKINIGKLLYYTCTHHTHKATANVCTAPRFVCRLFFRHPLLSSMPLRHSSWVCVCMYVRVFEGAVFCVHFSFPFCRVSMVLVCRTTWKTFGKFYH